MLNRVELIGHLGADPEVKKLEGGKTVVRLRLATTDKYKNKEGQLVENTEWHTITAWTPFAETLEKWAKKGSLLFVEGSLETRSWEDANTKEKRYATDIRLNSFRFLGGNNRSSDNNNNQQQTAGSTPSVNEPVMPIHSSPAPDDDLPF